MVRIVEDTVGPARKLALSELISAEERRARGRRARRWAMAAALPVLGAVLWLALRPRQMPLEQRFRSAAVTRGDVLREVRATGHLEAVTTVQIGAEVSGRLASVEVDFNDRVKAGQVLARFDPALLRAQLLQAQGLLRAAEASVRQATADAEHAVRSAVRSEILHRQALVSDADFEEAVVASRLAEQRLHAAEAQRAAQQGAVHLARTHLLHGEIRSPIDGIVVTRNVDPGQTVASAFQTPVLFTVAADLRAMRAIAAVDEADIGEIRQGQKATFTVNAWPERTFSGAVSEVRNSPVVVQDVVTYQVVIGVANPDLLLKPGMTAAVRIRTAEARDSMRVPNAALHFTPPGERQARAPGVWVVEEGRLQRHELVPGTSDGELTAVSGDVPDGRVLVELTPEGRKAYAGGR